MATPNRNSSSFFFMCHNYHTFHIMLGVFPRFSCAPAPGFVCLASAPCDRPTESDGQRGFPAGLETARLAGLLWRLSRCRIVREHACNVHSQGVPAGLSSECWIPG